MAFYRICPDCGAYLDPGEQCSCHEEYLIEMERKEKAMEEAAQYQNVDFDSAKEDVGYTNKWYFYNCKYDITNNAVFKMPMTGDNGKWKYGFIGFGMVAALGCAYVILNSKNYKKRKYRKIKK